MCRTIVEEFANKKLCDGWIEPDLNDNKDEGMHVDPHLAQWNGTSID